MENQFLAKSNPVESIQEHTSNLLERLEILKKIYPCIKYVNWDILELACKYHDLGKMNTKFQNKIGKKLDGYDILPDYLEEVKEVQHGYLSPAFLPKRELKEIFSEDELRILYQSIYYHHVRPDSDIEDIKLTIKNDLQNYFKDFKFEPIKNIESLNTGYSRYVKERIKLTEDDKKTVNTYIVTKGLLNKLDYTASSHVDVEFETENLLSKVEKFFDDNNYEYNELQKFMLKNQESNNIVIASTGIGKTEAALLWIGNNKGFFTLPLKVSINAIYDRLIDKIKCTKELTGLLHSDTISEYLNRNKENVIDQDYVGQTKQLSLPLTICTLDQLIDYIFKYDGYECKLATLSYSKLVIDEIQMYSPKLVGFLLTALKQLTVLGGKFSILTATLPTIFVDFMKELKIPFNEPKVFLKNQKRHRIKVFDETINIQTILSDYDPNKKILIILNTVKKSQEIFNEIKKAREFKDTKNVNLLHSRFIRKDRKSKEESILKFGDLKNKTSGIWITTQIVEASLDIDFDVLYTELSDISGLLQRMGRVYRNRELVTKDINVNIFAGEKTSGVGTGKTAVINKKIFELSKNEIMKYENMLLDENIKMKMIENIYNFEKLKDTDYYNEINETIRYMKDVEEFTFSKNENRLRDIFSVSVIPTCVYNLNKDLIEKKLSIIEAKETASKKQIARNEIQEFIVNVPGYNVINFESKYGLYNKINLSKYNEVKILNYEYNSEIGLTEPVDDEYDYNSQLV